MSLLQRSGDIVFGMDPIGFSVGFSLAFFLCGLMDFNQTCPDTSLGQPNGLLDFHDLDLVFKVTRVI